MTGMDAGWPRLDDSGLTPAQREARRGAIGGSDANVILSGDPGAILHLWRVKRGEVEAADLSDILPVMLGQWTEDFSRQWFERQAGLKVEDAGLSVRHPEHEWMACTLDGIVRHPDGRRSVFEAKHCSARATAREVVARYMPQLTHSLLVTGCDDALLSVLYGNNRWEAYAVELDLFYAAELVEAERRFWDCVTSGRRPTPTRVPPPPCNLRLALWSGRDAIRPAVA